MLLALKDSELRYRRLFEAAQDGILILDAGTGMIEDVNPYLIKMLGYSREELIGKKLWEVGAFKDIKASQIAFEALQENEYIRYEDLPLRAKDGRLVQVEFVSNVYLVDDEKVIQCNIRDNTQRKEAERAALKSEERYRTTLDTMMEGCQIIDYDWRYIYINDVAAKQGRSTPVAFLMRTVMEVYPGIESTPLFHTMRLSMEKRIPQRAETQFFFGDGTFGWFELSIQPVPQGIFILSMDISERKQADEALQLSEEKYRALVNEVNDGFYVTDSAGVFTFANAALAQLYGFEDPASLVGRKFSDFIAPEMPSSVGAAYRGAMQTGSGPQVINGQIERPDGTRAFIEIKPVFIVKEGQITGSRGIVRDVTERKRAEEALRESDKRFRALIENSTDAISLLDVNGIAIYDSPAAPGMLGYNRDELIGENMFTLIHSDDFSETRDLFQGLAETPGARANSTFRVRHKSGSWLWIEVVATNLLTEPSVKAIVLNYRNITERKQVEEALQESEAKFRSYIEHAPLGVFVADELGNYVEVNAAAAKMLGRTEAELLHLSILDVLAPQSLEAGLQSFQKVVQDGFATIELLFRRKDGIQFWVAVNAVRLSEGRFMSYCQDITERKLADDVVRNAREFLQSVQNAISEHIAILDDEGNIVQVNSAWRNFGAQNGLRLSNDCIGMNYLDVCDSAKGLYSDEAVLVANAIRKVRAGEKDEIQVEYPCHAADAQRWFIVRITSFENNQQKWIVVAHQNITERKQTEIDIRQRLGELEVLYQSGFAFSQPVNPKAIAEKMIGLLEQEMDWHHTAIRLYHPESETLELLAFNLPHLNSQAERSASEERFKTIQRPGQGLTGWVIQHRELVRSNDLKNDPRYFETFPGLESGLYVPIKLGERVIGVISIESERVRAFSESDERLTITLATQAAIAIDNAQLFESLKRLNIDLAAAYDATIEGWSHALDLRDKETEGHSQRVTQMTLSLAHIMGLSEEELVHVRRGALLHDIGKMGVPDGILLKPGPLTDEEWVKMRKHPTFAYEMLAPIRYLRLALDIPYCHHEKWDGSGYPRGLKGEEIPLAARIFAVLDVWDALSSDRSYRPAWAKEKVREHIRSLSGTHFDAQVVDEFLKMIE